MNINPKISCTQCGKPQEYDGSGLCSWRCCAETGSCDGKQLVEICEAYDTIEKMKVQFREHLESRHLKTKDHPEANGRKPEPGDVQWTAIFPLESGETLRVSMGKKGRDLLFGMLVADCSDSGEGEPG